MIHSFIHMPPWFVVSQGGNACGCAVSVRGASERARVQRALGVCAVVHEVTHSLFFAREELARLRPSAHGASCSKKKKTCRKTLHLAGSPSTRKMPQNRQKYHNGLRVHRKFYHSPEDHELEGRRGMKGHVLVAVLEMVVLHDEVQIASPDHNGTLHLRETAIPVRFFRRCPQRSCEETSCQHSFPLWPL